MLVSPALADALAAIISRVRAPSGAIPLVAAYDHHERRWAQPAPLLFQRRFRGYDQALQECTIRKMLAAAITRAGIADPATGQPLRYTPHDFRRMFITDAVLNGLPPHIAQVIAGHRDINVTMGYKAVYPDEAIQAHLAHLARRRAHGPARSTAPPPTKNGSSSSATSNDARSPPEHAGGHSPPRAPTSTPASLPHALARPGPASPDHPPRKHHSRPRNPRGPRPLKQQNGPREQI